MEEEDLKERVREELIFRTQSQRSISEKSGVDFVNLSLFKNTGNKLGPKNIKKLADLFDIKY